MDTQLPPLGIEYRPGAGALIVAAGTQLLVGPSLVGSARQLLRALLSAGDARFQLNRMLNATPDEAIAAVMVTPAETHFLLHGPARIRIHTARGVISELPELPDGWRGGKLATVLGWRMSIAADDVLDQAFVSAGGVAPAGEAWFGDIGEFTDSVGAVHPTMVGLNQLDETMPDESTAQTAPDASPTDAVAEPAAEPAADEPAAEPAVEKPAAEPGVDEAAAESAADEAAAATPSEHPTMRGLDGLDETLPDESIARSVPYDEANDETILDPQPSPAALAPAATAEPAPASPWAPPAPTPATNPEQGWQPPSEQTPAEPPASPQPAAPQAPADDAANGDLDATDADWATQLGFSSPESEPEFEQAPPAHPAQTPSAPAPATPHHQAPNHAAPSAPEPLPSAGLPSLPPLPPQPAAPSPDPASAPTSTPGSTPATESSGSATATPWEAQTHREHAPHDAPEQQAAQHDRQQPFAPRLVSNHGHTLPLDYSYVIGRKPAVDRAPEPQQTRLIVVPSPSDEISRSHCVVTFDQGNVVAWDLGSANGTRVLRGGSIPEQLSPMIAVTISHGDILDLGDGASFWID